MRRLFLLLATLLTLPAHAHIGSPDTFLQAHAGPYAFLLAAHPPQTYPGTLELNLRLNPEDHLTSLTAAVDNETPTPVHLYDAGTATTSLWLPTPESHTIHLKVQGSEYTFALPGTVLPPQSFRAPTSIPLIIAALFFLGLGGWLVYGNRRIVGFLLLILSLVLFLSAAMQILKQNIQRFNIGTVTPTLTPDGNLELTLRNNEETFDDLAPDHGKLLHLFLIREPEKDILLHLHPDQLSAGKFTTPLPSMPPGTYTLFADLYHRDGRNETLSTQLTLPSQQRPFPNRPDDSYANLPPLSHPNLQNIAHLPDGYTITLDSDALLIARDPITLHVTLLDPTGNAPKDMAPYLGMSAHAIVLRTDNQVFAHIHPGGTLPMLTSAPDMSMPGMDMSTPTSNQADIPYGFPTPGPYRLFVQMKHTNTIETAAFDLTIR